MDTRLKLKYSGLAVEAGLMDVYQASANMIAFSEFMVLAAKATYGEQIEARAEVAGFGRGPFITHIVFNFMGQVATILSTVSPDQLLTTVNQAFELWKHLKGNAPKAIEQADEQEFGVINNNGQVIQVQAQTMNLVFSEKASNAVRQFVQEPLTKDGIDNLEIETEQKQIIVSVNQRDARSFRLVRPTEAITDTTVEMTLIIEALVFKEDNKWRFSDGQASFYADILDREFLAKVDAGELFGKGDLLRVALRITQQRAGIKISTERAVLKVYEHRRGSEQYGLL